MALERTVKKPAKKKTGKDARRHMWLLVLTTLLVAPNEKINQGLDIQGGLSVVLTAKSDDGGAVSAEDMEASRAIIESRVNALGASEATVQTQGSNQILVQIPGLSDTEEALATIGKTGSLVFARLDSFTDQDVVTRTASTARRACTPTNLATRSPRARRSTSWLKRAPTRRSSPATRSPT